MKFNLKKATATAAIAAMIASGAIFANGAEVKEVKATPLAVAYETINDVTMLPLRSIAEHFGYTVEWHDESRSVSMTRGAQYITFAIDEDAYSFSKMAPQKLGTAPILFNDETTYVPASFFTELIGFSSKVADGEIELSEPNVVTVAEITEEGGILVLDESLGEVLVLIGEDTKITANGKEVSAELIEKDMLLNVEYSEQMTRSIPPQTTAISIELLYFDEVGEEVAEELEKPVVSAEILSIEENGAIVVNDEINGEVIVFVTEDTKITEDGKEASVEDLKAGQKITVEYAGHMTMSLPPQTSAVSIVIGK